MTHENAIALAAQHGLTVGFKRLCNDGRTYEIKRIYAHNDNPYLIVFDHTFANRIYTIEDFDPSRSYWDCGYTDE